jgi:hypothetical protein
MNELIILLIDNNEKKFAVTVISLFFRGIRFSFLVNKYSIAITELMQYRNYEKGIV